MSHADDMEMNDKKIDKLTSVRKIMRCAKNNGSTLGLDHVRHVIRRTEGRHDKKTERREKAKKLGKKISRRPGKYT